MTAIANDSRGVVLTNDKYTRIRTTLQSTVPVTVRAAR
jgi:hypothetical protein